MTSFVHMLNPVFVRAISIATAFVGLTFSLRAAEESVDDRFQHAVLPFLKTYCYDCHAGDAKEGGVQFSTDNLSNLLQDKMLWLKVLRNIRADLMPPRESEHPSKEEVRKLVQWIQSDVFEINSDDPFPGASPIRRLNRNEYRNTIRDLMGIDFNSEVVFPPDDSGFGFDNVSEAMTLSPMLIEKYLQAAKFIVNEAVPKSTWVTRKQDWKGKDFVAEDGSPLLESMRHNRPNTVKKVFSIEHASEYRLEITERLHGSFDFHPGRYRVRGLIDGQELYSAEYKWEEAKSITKDFLLRLHPGTHELAIELSTIATDKNPVSESEGRYASYTISSVVLEGPLDEEFREHPKRYDLFFHRDSPPADWVGKREYAFEILSRFASKAFRRPASPSTSQRLVSIAESIYQQSDVTFEAGIEMAMMAVLASPQFLFRVEDEISVDEESVDRVSRYPYVDEYSLASRLSYLLWSTMPDEELFTLAQKGELRKNLLRQVQRMVKDKRSEQFVESFAGQWLRARDVEHVSIDPIAAFGHQKEYASLRAMFGGRGKPTDRELADLDAEKAKARRRYIELGAMRDRFDASVRSAMRQETEKSFEYIVREDRSILELIDADYVFVNEKLATLYGMEGIRGKELQRVALAPGSPRGGVLTQGTMLAVTSNPTRTSPVKRGLYILENILGTPAPPAPPNVPALEDAADRFAGREPSLQELLAIHREAALCSSCHSRMDPLGLALENFNAIGSWRDKDGEQTIESEGQLITGEEFKNIRELKRVLKTDRRMDFYRCVTEKLFIYALGRGLECFDEVEIDRIVESLEREQGRFSVLLEGIVRSTPFQRKSSLVQPAKSDTR